MRLRMWLRGSVSVAFALLIIGSGCTPATAPTTPNDPNAPPSTDTPVVPQTGSISGRLTVVDTVGASTLFETEPNNVSSTAQFVASVAAGDHYLIFGSVARVGDPIDMFGFQADEPVQVTMTLTFSDTDGFGTNDFDLGYYDFVEQNCYPGNPDVALFTTCFDSTDIPEVGTFEASGSFAVAAVAFAGRGNYQLEIAFEAPGTPALIAQPAGEGRSKTDPAPQDEPTFVPDELVVRFDPTADPAACQAALAACNMTLIDSSPSGWCRVRRINANASDKMAIRTARTTTSLAALQAQPMIQEVGLNYIHHIARVPDDPHYDIQWHYPLINLPAAWDMTTGSDDVIVAVVDTGILGGHPDIKGRLIDGYDFIASASSARDGDGRDPDPTDEGDLFGGPGRSSFHGTHVAGTIGATTNNGIGVAGVTWKTRLMPVRALGVGGGTDFDIAESIRYAAGLPNASDTTPVKRADIINMSITSGAGNGFSTAIASAVVDAESQDVLMVAAAGNDASSAPSYPAAFNEVMAVGATDLAQQRAPYSNFGSWLEIVAPGGDLGADLNGDAWADGVLSLSASDAGGTLEYEYRLENGTSMASPHVAGVAALVLAADPDLSAAEVREILTSTARDLGAAGRDDVFGYGMVDAAAAVQEAMRRAGTEAPTTPRMALSTNALDFGATQTELSISVSNIGGGQLDVTNVAVEPADASDWLSVVERGLGAGTNVSQIVVRVDRTGQPDGRYEGHLTVEATGLEPQTVNVRMAVGVAQLLDESVYVLAVAPDTEPLQTVAEDVTGASGDLDFRISDLPAGRYAIYAGTDRDNDGVICEFGDLCGALPSTIEPTIIDLAEGEQVDGADFALTLQVIQQPSASGGPTVPVLRRVDAGASGE